jgi:hypothetical protein
MGITKPILFVRNPVRITNRPAHSAVRYSPVLQAFGANQHFVRKPSPFRIINIETSVSVTGRPTAG